MKNGIMHNIIYFLLKFSDFGCSGPYVENCTNTTKQCDASC